ncbi:MAG: LysR family transcriptional regulator [Desulfacinum sp.]|jgi:DNA-binding transcriptional LysR family regulator|nr:LysR family transcriptional regulator [Desulfacinum sp.]MBZ4660076.1 Transcriptional regulator, LysR family [Desulfacinum sp.]
MEWNLFSLKVFSEVVRRNNFTKAARALGLTQPAVSQQIQNLEKQAGCPLMVRKRMGGVSLTEAGKVVWGYAQKMAELLRDMERELEPWTSNRNQSITLGCCCIAGEHIVPSYTVAFKERRPHVTVHCHVGRCADIFGRVLDGTLDVAVAGVPPRDPRLAYVPFVRMPLAFFEAGRDSPRRLSIQGLVREPVVLREEGSGTRWALLKFLEDNGLRLDDCCVVATSESNEAVKEMVANGLAWSILPLVVIQREVDQGRLTPIEIEEGCPPQEFYVVRRKHRIPDGPRKEFIQLLLHGKSPENKA